MFQTVGYQTLENRNNIPKIISDAPFICYRKDAWLGYGYYFWDNSLDYAKKWGENGYKVNGYVVCKCSLNIERLFDLVGNVEHQQIFEMAQNKFQERGKKKLRFVEILNMLRKNNLSFDYQAIRAADANPNTQTVPFTDKGEDGPIYIMNPRIQICVFEKHCTVFSRPVEIIPSHSK